VQGSRFVPKGSLHHIWLSIAQKGGHPAEYGRKGEAGWEGSTVGLFSFAQVMVLTLRIARGQGYESWVLNYTWMPAGMGYNALTNDEVVRT
jgi:hypothetical protein